MGNIKVCPPGVLKHFRSLYPNKLTCPNCIPPGVLAGMADVLASPLKTCSRCLWIKELSDDWMKANITQCTMQKSHLMNWADNVSYYSKTNMDSEEIVVVNANFWSWCVTLPNVWMKAGKQMPVFFISATNYFLNLPFIESPTR